jgi:hypothetical protein
MPAHRYLGHVEIGRYGSGDRRQSRGREWGKRARSAFHRRFTDVSGSELRSSPHFLGISVGPPFHQSETRVKRPFQRDGLPFVRNALLWFSIARFPRFGGHFLFDSVGPFLHVIARARRLLLSRLQFSFGRLPFWGHSQFRVYPVQSSVFAFRSRSTRELALGGYPRSYWPPPGQRLIVTHTHRQSSSRLPLPWLQGSHKIWRLLGQRASSGCFRRDFMWSTFNGVPSNVPCPHRRHRLSDCWITLRLSLRHSGERKNAWLLT